MWIVGVLNMTNGLIVILWNGLVRRVDVGGGDLFLVQVWKCFLYEVEGEVGLGTIHIHKL